MSTTRGRIGAFALLLVGMSFGSGCGITSQGPALGFMGIPIPVSPYFQKEKEDQYWMKERYDKVPILGPLTSGGPVTALDPPSDDQIMRAVERAHPL